MFLIFEFNTRDCFFSGIRKTMLLCDRYLFIKTSFYGLIRYEVSEKP